MKKLIKKIVSNIRTAATRAAIAWQVFRTNPFGYVKRALTAGASGEGYIDTAVKILIAVVLGALLLAGLYALFGDVVMPTLKERIEGMFDYAGNLD
ncbi:MAG TPA: hypothetical protein DD735_01200 [Clostridiales bacterium]|jgi:hypothetical protein|nr:hypothetical protein [Clostridiales bacterium]